MTKKTTFRIDLEECTNQRCVQCKNAKERGSHIENDLCKDAISEIDKLPTRCVGDWGYQKIYRLVQYFGIFSKGMHKKWSGLNYVEVCSGPGRCVMRNNGQEINGTVLAILKHPSFQSYLKQAIFIDYNSETVDVLNKRIERTALKGKARAVCVDFNDIASLEREISHLGQRSLNLVLIDPTECNVPFLSIKTIAKFLKNVDFIVNIASGTDIRRNIQKAILNTSFSRVRDKYEDFLGVNKCLQEEKIQKIAQRKNLDLLMKEVMSIYKRSWRGIGYNNFSEKPVEHYYNLMFASKSSMGLKFWDKANIYDYDGQKTFWGV